MNAHEPRPHLLYLFIPPATPQPHPVFTAPRLRPAPHAPPPGFYRAPARFLPRRISNFRRNTDFQRGKYTRKDTPFFGSLFLCRTSLPGGVREGKRDLLYTPHTYLPPSPPSSHASITPFNSMPFAFAHSLFTFNFKM